MTSPELERHGNDEVLERLKNWGVSEVRFLLGTTGELDLKEYVKFLQEELKSKLEFWKDQFDPGVVGEARVAEVSAPNGFGHRRLSRYFEVLLNALDIEVVHVDMGRSDETTPRIMKFFSYLKTAYINGSNRMGKENGLTAYEEKFSYEERTFFTFLLEKWEKYAPDHFYNTIMGKPGKNVTPVGTRRIFRLIDKAFGDEFRDYLSNQGVTHHLVLYPMVNALVRGRTTLIGTDSEFK